ncbi:MAG: hypothetical protein ACFFBW_12540 [Promethearchaeota archaeon]
MEYKINIYAVLYWDNRGIKLNPENKKGRRPRCDKCGEKIYPTYRIFKNYFWRPIPSYCPHCGEEINLDKKKRVMEHDDSLYMILCISVIMVFIIILIIF